ncbi:MAG: hypothetical protein HY843_02560 [Bdellovibrio sp.]|nr:hypothetical protein [Bdellovibrio sp.]
MKKLFLIPCILVALIFPLNLFAEGEVVKINSQIHSLADDPFYSIDEVSVLNTVVNPTDPMKNKMTIKVKGTFEGNNCPGNGVILLIESKQGNFDFGSLNYLEEIIVSLRATDYNTDEIETNPPGCLAYSSPQKFETTLSISGRLEQSAKSKSVFVKFKGRFKNTFGDKVFFSEYRDIYIKFDKDQGWSVPEIR